MMLDLFIALYLGGMVTWLAFAEFGQPAWDNAFFIWEAVAQSSLMCWLSLFFCCDVKIKKKVFPVLIFSGVKLLWEIVSAWTGIDINSEKIVMALFLMAISITTYLAFRPAGYLPKSLTKRLFL